MHATAFPDHLGVAEIACRRVSRSAERNCANMTCLRDNASRALHEADVWLLEVTDILAHASKREFFNQNIYGRPIASIGIPARSCKQRAAGASI
jgi:hypothetical protein